MSHCPVNFFCLPTPSITCIFIFTLLYSHLPTRTCVPRPTQVKDKDDPKVRDFTSDQEQAKDIPTKIKISEDLATPAPNTNIKLPFIPKQIYAQIRRYDNQLHLARSAAFAEAKTDEEILNAPRLREVIAHTKKQEVYEERGYEDAGYDHGGYRKAVNYLEKTEPINNIFSSDPADRSSSAISNDIPKFSSSVNRRTNSSHHSKAEQVDRSKRDSESAKNETVFVALDGSTTEISINFHKYPFYKNISSVDLDKYSVLRYISNPKDIPIKVGNKMSFYESKNQIQCLNPETKSTVINEEENKWGQSSSEFPRVHLADHIKCLRKKFFGEDPLDNPFFKEESVGFPEIIHQSAVEPASSVQKLKKNISDIISRSSFSKSPVRRWIESLAEPHNSEMQKLTKRSTSEESEHINSGDKKRQKVFFIGGFLSQESSQPLSSSSTTSASTSQPLTYVKLMNDELDFEESKPIDTELNDEEGSEDNATVSVEIKKIPPSSQNLPISPRIINKPDVMSSHHNFQDLIKPENTHQSEPIPPLKLEYKEPTWRDKSKTRKNHENEMDSLLYVIDPKTGEGRWMKLLKVEEMDDMVTDTSFKNSFRSTRYSSSENGERDVKTGQLKHKTLCQQEIKDSSSDSHFPEYDTDHISDLIKEVAPLKAPEIEINSLVSPREVDSNPDLSFELEDDSYTLLDLENRAIQANKSMIHHIPEPHERLYYYVVDK